MKTLNTLRKALFTVCLICAMTVLCLIVSCNDDDENTPSDLLVGEWTITSTTMDLFVNEKSLVQYLMDEADMTLAEAQVLADLIQNELMGMFNGTIDFKSGGTYTAVFDGDPDNGTWKISSDGETITLDQGTIDEMLAAIKTLTESTLIIEMTQDEDFDLNGDELLETIVMKIVMSFSKQSTN
ncbi:MAG: lipocalin family protein [Cyclobacteriaceae bacterium]|nr:lipocalin family protein [Cyclobacteriaceae bacterium]